MMKCCWRNIIVIMINAHDYSGVVVGIDHDYYDVPPTALHHNVVNALASDFS